MSKKIPFNQCLSPEDKMIEALRAKVAELETEIRMLVAGGRVLSGLLTTEQARTKVLTDALERICEIASPYRDGVKFNYIADICQEALAIQPNPGILRERDARLVESIADEWQYGACSASETLQGIADKIRKGEF